MNGTTAPDPARAPAVPQASATPLVTEADIDAYERDGAVCIRQVLTSSEIDLLRGEIEDAIQRKGEGYKNHTERNKSGGGQFVHLFQMWLRSGRLAEFNRASALPDVAARLMRSSRINLFFDQAFAKEPGSVDPTPWHNDQPFWPIVGRHVITTWVALDVITKQSGAVEFVAGSHNWNRWFQPRSFSGENELAKNPDFEEIPDIEANRADYDIISWDLQPGDILAFNGMTLHGAAGNSTSDRRRRGYAVRFTGDDVVYKPWSGSTSALLRDDLRPGGALDSDYYPVLRSVA